MEKKYFVALIIQIICVSLFCSCVFFIDNSHSHSYSTEWSSDSLCHWHNAICEHKDQKQDVELHLWNDGKTIIEPTENSEGKKEYICTICNYLRVDVEPKLPHSHKYSDEWSTDIEKHWVVAICEHTDQITSFDDHIWNDGEVITEPTEQDEGVREFLCTICGYKKQEKIDKLLHEHKFSSSWDYDETNHWHVATCEHEDEKNELGYHLWDNGSLVNEKEKLAIYIYSCTTCNFSKTEFLYNGQSMDLPLNYKNVQNLDLSDLNNQIVSLVKIGGLTTGGALTIDLDSVETDKFETMSFSSGNLIIQTVNDYSGNTVNISYGGTIIAHGEFVGNIAVLDLTNKTLNFSGMSIDFFPKRDGTFFVGTIEDGQISKITGLTLSSVDISLNSVIDTDDAFEPIASCDIKEGVVTTIISTDKGWKNIQIEYPITLSGAVNGVSVLNSCNEKVIYLIDTNFESKKTNISSTIKFSCKKDGEIDFAQIPFLTTEINLYMIDNIIYH